ncbi:MAG: glycosyltransferase [Gemmatimonadales bacterium]|nr:glycosyltransferase [Gemmatimonadales bacterium]
MFAGVTAVLVAKFNERYHRTGGALIRALESLGVTAVPCEERTGTVERLTGRSLGSRLRRLLVAHRPDLVIVFKGGLLEPEVIDSLRSVSSARWANWFPDSPHLLDLSLRIGRAYDRCFIFDTSMVARHLDAGHQAEYLAEGCEPEYHRPLPDPAWPHSGIAFVGSREPLRAQALESVADLGLNAWGPDMPRGPLYGDDFIKAFSNADIALNIHQFFGEPAAQGRYGTGANRRVFEIAGIGTVQLVDAKADIARSFVPDEEVVLFRSSAELRDRALDLLAEPARRAEIAARARARALREHTWRHRLEILITRTLS